MKKKMTIITVQEYSNITSFAVKSDVDVNATEALEKAKKWTKENVTEPCDVRNIPEKALKKFGLQKIDSEVICVKNEQLVMTDAEKQGVRIATCSDCSAFDDGSCFKYGGTCNPENEAGTCFHGNDAAVRLRYDGWFFGPILILENDNLSPLQVMSLMDIKPENYNIQDFDENLLELEAIDEI